MKFKILLPMVFLVTVQCTHAGGSKSAQEANLDNSIPNSPTVVAKQRKCTKEDNQGDVTRVPPPSAKVGVTKPIGKGAENTKPYISSDYDCN